jgi:hypothetical protein
MDVPDVAQTYECFGISAANENGFIAHGHLLVSARVYDILRRLKLRAARFAPVQIIED